MTNSSDWADLEDLSDLAPTSSPASAGGISEIGGVWEPCPKCHGTGQTRWGICFKCQGKKGRNFKTPPAVRARARTQTQARNVRTAAEHLDVWKASHPAEWEWVVSRERWETAQDGRGDFGRSLRAGIAKYGDLTEKQMAAIHSSMAKRAAAQETKGPAPVIAVERIEEAFARAAGNGLQRLTLRLATTRIVEGKEVLDHDYLFKPAPAKGKNPGAIYVTENGEYLGKVVEGRFRCVPACDDYRRDQVVAVASDPAQAAIAHGKVLSNCGICGRELSDPESVARGVGPICASNYGF